MGRMRQPERCGERTRTRRRSPVARLMVFVAALPLLALACSSDSGVAWDDLAATPGAEAYEGSIERILDDRLSGRMNERGLKLVDSRVEYLPDGTDWAGHVAWRAEHSAGMTEVQDRLDVPEPDAPVVMAEFSSGGDTLFLIGRADDDGERLVVLTALTRPA